MFLLIRGSGKGEVYMPANKLPSGVSKKTEREREKENEWMNGTLSLATAVAAMIEGAEDDPVCGLAAQGMSLAVFERF